MFRTYIFLTCVLASDAHFGRSPIIDRVKFQTTGLFQHPSGPWTDRKNISGCLVSSCFYDDRSFIGFPSIQGSGGCKRQRCQQVHQDCLGQHVVAEVSGHVWCTVKVHDALQALQLNQKQIHDQKPTYSSCSSDVNFVFNSKQQILFSASLVSYCFCIIRTPCPIKFWSPRHFVYQVLKKCAALALHVH